MLGELSAHAFLLGSDGSYNEWDATCYEVRAPGKNLAKPPRSQRFSGQKKRKRTRDYQICQGINPVATIVFQTHCRNHSLLPSTGSSRIFKMTIAATRQIRRQKSSDTRSPGLVDNSEVLIDSAARSRPIDTRTGGLLLDSASLTGFPRRNLSADLADQRG